MMAEYLTPEEQAARAEAERIHAEAHRDKALDIAANEAVSRDIAEARAADARIAAGQAWQAADEMDTDRRVLRNELASERAASSNSAFGFYLTLGVLLAALLIGGFYLYQRSQNPDNVVVNAAPAPSNPAPVIVTPSQPTVTPPPVTVTTPPPVVNVTPPAQPAPEVNNRINVTPPAPSGPVNPGNPGSTGATTPETGTVEPGSTGSGTGSTNGGGG
jgi:hypothetical protein